MFIPGTTKHNYPLFLFANKCGNHTVLDFKEISIIERPWIHKNCLDYYPKRGSRADKWAIENSVKRGYAIATFHVDDMDPDTLNWSDGIHAKSNHFYSYIHNCILFLDSLWPKRTKHRSGNNKTSCQTTATSKIKQYTDSSHFRDI